jgi:peptidoglycan/xylan/chitin deacetylase (PgdA/CDA1 family)
MATSTPDGESLKSDPIRLSRRLLLTLGGAAFVAACNPGGEAATWRDPAASAAPVDAFPTPTPTTTARPTTPTKPWIPATPVKPIPGVCPHLPGVVDQPGGPQHYLPCHGTNIALTIDDGPSPIYTPQILALLAKYQVAATFCMIGRNAAANPSLVAAVADHGHHIANHTYTHPLSLPQLTPSQISDEINRTSDTLSHLAGGTRPELFRAPGGNWSPAILATCAKAGMHPLDWSVDPRDWSLPGVPHIADVILTLTRPGVIILEHDGGGNRQQTLQALAIVLPRLLDAGYTFAQP